MTKKRLIASTVMEKQRAIRKTALISAPTTCNDLTPPATISHLMQQFPAICNKFPQSAKISHRMQQFPTKQNNSPNLQQFHINVKMVLMTLMTRHQKLKILINMNLATELTSARAQPKVFCFHSFGLTVTLTQAITRAITSLSMWKLSATRAMLLVMLPTTSSITM